MSNEPENPPEAPDTATATAAEAEKPEQQEKLYTKADMERAIRDRLARVKNAPKSEPKAQPTKETPPATEDFSDVREQLAYQGALEDVMDELDWKPTKDERALLRTMFKAGGVEQMTALAEKFKGSGKTQSPASPATTPAAAVTPGKPYVPPPGSPNSPPDILEQNPAKWNQARIDRARADGTFKQEVEKFYGSGQGGLFRRHIPKVS